MSRRGHDSSAWVVLLILRDGTTCYLCGQGTDPDDPWQPDHVIPRAAGGKTELDNLALTHRSCNQEKYTRATAG